MSLAHRDPGASDIVVLNPDLQEYPSGGAVFAMDTEQMGDLDSLTEQPKDFLPLEGVHISPAEEDKMDVHRGEDMTRSVEVIADKGSDEDEGEFLSLPTEGQDVAMTSISPPKLPATSMSLQDKHSKGDSKTSNELSPETETNSDGFTTADFYIDESMPSSMTDSPPTKKLIAELQHSILMKNNLIESKDKDLEERTNEVKEVKEKLNKITDNFQLLHDLATKGAKQLKTDVVSLQTDYNQEKVDFQLYIESVTQQIIDVINKFELEQTRVNDEAAVALRSHYDREVQELAHKLEVEEHKLNDSMAETAVYQTQLRGMSEKCEELKLDMEDRISQMELAMAREVELAKNTLILEHEVELEKVQHDFQCDMDTKDTELTEVRDTLDQKEKVIKELTRCKEEEIENLRRKFQEEKDEVIRLLQEEFEAKKVQLEGEVRASIEAAHQEDIKALETTHTEGLETTSRQLREELEAAKQESLNNLRDQLQQSHIETLETIRNQMTQEKEQEVTQLRQELNVEFEKTKSYMEGEWESRRQQLEVQLKEREENVMSLERHGCIITEIKQACQEEKESEIAQVSIAYFMVIVWNQSNYSMPSVPSDRTLLAIDSKCRWCHMHLVRSFLTLVECFCIIVPWQCW